MPRDTVAELCEAKRLMKAAVEDFRILGTMLEDGRGHCTAKIPCSKCVLGGGNLADDCQWRYTAEALALIGKDIDVPATEDDTNVGHKSGDWISVEDRLPSENTLVLCYARSTTGEGNGYFLGALAHGVFWFLKVNDIGHVSCPVLHWEVTHWQPLPEPPKEG